MFVERDAREWLEKFHGSAAWKNYRDDIGIVPPETLSGLPLQALYTPSDVDAARLAAEQTPGKPPFTRGIHSGYRQRLWTFRQYSGFGSAAETNARWKSLLAGGGTGLSTAFDLPTQLGLDPDDPRSRGEVGRVGVPVASVDDMRRLFEGIDIAAVSVSMTINAPAAVLLAFYQVVAEERGVTPEKLRGTVQNDILKEYAARNNYIFPPVPSMSLTVDILEHCRNVLTNFYPISVSGYHLREAGCTAPQEIAFTLANGLAYLQAAAARGIRPEEIGPQLSFFFASTTELIEEIAKFRAARRLWAALMTERFGVSEDKARQLRFHVQTAGSLLTSQQPENNLVRVGIQALAAVLGGCQSLHTNSYDEALGLPGELSARLALATQQILAFETGIANVADPCGGSYAIEALTDQLEKDARKIISEVDALGGAVKAVESGFYQRRIAEAAFKYQRELETGTRHAVGVNLHTDETNGGAASSVQPLRPEMEQDARQAVAAVRAGRNAQAAQRALVELESAARADSGRMPAILQAARARCTVGEICGVLRRVYGEYRPG
ncbi:MAG TPA: methylmalonyl-CoA mutase family protein [Planctomycetota bacterium]|nr:methylmalonyl-CoA mutase family protein [Planctomycetota bacterium]